MDEQARRREKNGTTPLMMTNDSSLRAIIPVAVAESLAPLKGIPRPPLKDVEKAKLKASEVDTRR